MDGMGTWMSDCITWYDDTSTQMYNNGFIEFRSDSSGCWSYIGQQATSGKAVKKIVFRKTGFIPH